MFFVEYKIFKELKDNVVKSNFQYWKIFTLNEDVIDVVKGYFRCCHLTFIFNIGFDLTDPEFLKFLFTYFVYSTISGLM